MPKLPDHIRKIGDKYGLTKDDLWNCHGTWVAYHRALERIAAEQRINFQPPTVMEAKSPSVAICVFGTLGERTEWSIGEAAPNNNKNAYPWAMAEKRAKDRVILKLLDLHGLVYSEEEADDFKPERAAAEPSAADFETITAEQCAEIDERLTKLGANREAFLDYFRVTHLEDLPAHNYKTAIALLDKKAAGAKK